MTETTTDDIAYRTIGDETLLGRLYRPQTSGPATWLVDVHGGAWGSGDRLNNAIIHEDLAAHGVGVFALDFRLSTSAKYPAPVEDVSYGIRWFKENASKIGVHASKIGALGSSSGAQQMGVIALAPGNPKWTAAEPAFGHIDASVEFFVACWPILDPLARYRMAQEKGNDRLVGAHDAYFPDEAAMEEGNPYMLLERGDATTLPPMLVIQGTADANVEHTRADMFADLYKKKGGKIAVEKFDGMPHTFVTADPEAEASKQAIVKIREFVLAQ